MYNFKAAKEEFTRLMHNKYLNEAVIQTTYRLSGPNIKGEEFKNKELLYKFIRKNLSSNISINGKSTVSSYKKFAKEISNLQKDNTSYVNVTIDDKLFKISWEIVNKNNKSNTSSNKKLDRYDVWVNITLSGQKNTKSIYSTYNNLYNDISSIVGTGFLAFDNPRTRKHDIIKSKSEFDSIVNKYTTDKDDVLHFKTVGPAGIQSGLSTSRTLIMVFTTESFK